MPWATATPELPFGGRRANRLRMRVLRLFASIKPGSSLDIGESATHHAMNVLRKPLLVPVLLPKRNLRVSESANRTMRKKYYEARLRGSPEPLWHGFPSARSTDHAGYHRPMEQQHRELLGHRPEGIPPRFPSAVRTHSRAQSLNRSSLTPRPVLYYKRSPSPTRYRRAWAAVRAAARPAPGSAPPATSRPADNKPVPVLPAADASRQN
ncbi:hypothetical protein BC628DRAFT_722980 [Trametes gibbosa]|nr:hypothetical protein BC628DRAFT_722980 [Trametes gibbosa]